MKSSGHAWNNLPAVEPRLLLTVDCDRERALKVTRLVNAAWVLDYSKTKFGWTKAGSTRAPWRLREARIAHLYPPLTPYWEDCTRDVTKTEPSTYILFEGGERAGLRALIKPSFRYARLRDRGGLLLELMEEIARVGQARGENGFWEAQGLFCRVLDLLHRAQWEHDEEYGLPAGTGVAAAPSFSAAVDDYLREHLGQRVRLEDVARHFHVSLSTLAHRYQLETGTSPAARLIALRVNMVRGLLLSGHRLDRIAAQTGFYDAYHLSKTFKRVTGLSPRLYLRTAREDVRSGREGERAGRKA